MMMDDDGDEDVGDGDENDGNADVGETDGDAKLNVSLTGELLLHSLPH